MIFDSTLGLEADGVYSKRVPLSEQDTANSPPLSWFIGITVLLPFVDAPEKHQLSAFGSISGGRGINTLDGVSRTRW